MYCVRLTETCHSTCILLLFCWFWLLLLFLICKSLWKKASAKWLNVNVNFWMTNKYGLLLQLVLIHFYGHYLSYFLGEWMWPVSRGGKTSYTREHTGKYSGISAFKLLILSLMHSDLQIYYFFIIIFIGLLAVLYLGLLSLGTAGDWFDWTTAQDSWWACVHFDNNLLFLKVGGSFPLEVQISSRSFKAPVFCNLQTWLPSQDFVWSRQRVC